MTAFLMLGPWTPMLFQGQEFNASAPFLFFADHEPDLADAVRRGRAEFMGQFPSLASTRGRDRLHDPGAHSSLERCRLDHRERIANSAAWELHADLIRLRRKDPVIAEGARVLLETAVLTDQAFLLRYSAESGERLLLVNLGRDVRLAPAPQPLLAPPARCRWTTIWHSDAWKYGGIEQPVGETEEGWLIPSESATLLAPVTASAEAIGT
jgi:maltooligosyltrehalose trehalohydrolase